MPQVKVLPTKTNLIRLRRDVGFAQEGYNLLEQKRQILVVELMGLMDKTAEAQEKAEAVLSEAYMAYRNAVLAMGRKPIQELAPAVHIETNIAIKARRVMGVSIPNVEVTILDQPPYFSFGETSFWANEAIEKFKAVLESLAKLAEMRISLLRIAQEVRKTMKRVNALEKIVIPDYRNSIKYIESTLEENERDTFATLKRLKAQLEDNRR
jgi:V/A-type H+/Na+-transporting ATPase subunit D